MKHTASLIREKLTISFWFVPSLFMIGASALAYTAVWIDETGRVSPIITFNWLITTDVNGARVLLSAIASSMIGVAGVVFSITIVVLTVAMGQLGPRLLRSFMRQHTIQISLGTYIATFLYCLLLLIRLQVSDEKMFTPHVSVSLAVAFAVICLGVLIYYIHHVAVFIQADSVITDVSGDLDATIEALFPSRLDQYPTKLVARIDEPDTKDTAAARPIRVSSGGYVNSVDVDRLVAIAQERDLLIALSCRPGVFVIEGTTIGQVWPKERIDDDTATRINAAIVLGGHPTVHDNVEFAVRQLVEVAVRALSPGINDPFTAIACIDKLTSALGKLLRRLFPARYRHDEHDQLRVITDAVTFPHLLDTAFNQIRQNASTSVSVSIRLLDAVALLAPLAERDEDRAALGRHAAEIYAACRDQTSSPSDCEDLRVRYDAVAAVLPQANQASLAKGNLS